MRSWVAHQSSPRWEGRKGLIDVEVVVAVALPRRRASPGEGGARHVLREDGEASKKLPQRLDGRGELTNEEFQRCRQWRR
jgi:hypothetical protein